MDTIFGVARKRFNRTLGYWIVESSKNGKVWDFVCSSQNEVEANQTYDRYSIHCTQWVD